VLLTVSYLRRSCRWRNIYQ